MKPIFKNSAIAILVALGVSGCLITDSGDSTASAKKTPINSSTVGGSSGSTADNTNSTDSNSGSTGSGSGSTSTDTSTDSGSATTNTGTSSSTDAEQEANKWRSSQFKATIQNPSGSKGRSLEKDRYHNYHITTSTELPYVDGYTGTKEPTPVNNLNPFDAYGIDFYLLAVGDSHRPYLLGWHKGRIEDRTINGSEISKIDNNYKIVERTNPEGVNYHFKNTPYATYGAVYNNYEANLFVNYNKNDRASINGSDSTKIGEYEVINGRKTSKIKYNDNVAGDATYKGGVLAHVERVAVVPQGNERAVVLYEKSPYIDGNITINAHFGDSAETTYASAVLESKVLGTVNFEKRKMDLTSPYITFRSSANVSKKTDILDTWLEFNAVGSQADEMIGTIRHAPIEHYYRVGEISKYDAVFAAQKQAK